MHSPLGRPRPAAAFRFRENTALRAFRGGHSCPMAAADSSNGASANGSSSDQRPFTEIGRMSREMKRKAENPFPRQRFNGHSGGLKNQVQLSAYGHHIGNNLKDLEAFMDKNLEGAISGLHLLPVYPSTGDGGFAPTTYKEIDPDMGTWKDVERLAEKYDLMLEFMVNHISPGSAEFKDFKEHGAKSKFADLFVSWERIWGKCDPSPDQLAMIRTRKPEAPVIEVKCNDGFVHRLWCTFGEQQIDIDPFSASGQEFVKESLKALGTHGAKLVRLDAFGYATKKADTRCFFEEPETWELLAKICEDSKDHNTEILCEVHEEYETNIRLAERGYWVYDFALPLLVLHAFTFQTAKNLRHWLTICPRRQITVLDTHDGLGIDDIAGLTDVADVEQLQHVVAESLGCNPNFKYFYHKDDQSYHGRPHQYNCTYFSAVERNPRTYLLARVIQFFTPGIPMIYYVGLLAGANDFDAVEEQGPRGINRHRYSVKEAEEALQQPVVKALLQLCRFRNTHEAFMGDVEVADLHEDELLEVTWRNGPHRATLHANVKDSSFYCEATAPQGDKMRTMKWMLGTEDCSEGCVPGEPPVKWQSEEMCSPPAV